MTDKKNPTAPPDFETARTQLAEPGFFEGGIAQIEALRGQLGDELPNDLLDGARRLYERSKIPVEQITDDDPVLERTEAIFVIAMVMEMFKRTLGRDFFVLEDLKGSNPDAYRRALEIDRRVNELAARKVSEIVTLLFEFYLVVRQARTGLDAKIYLESLRPLLDSLRGCGFADQRLDALAEKVKGQLEGQFEQ